jgi:predicted transcriptional regulator
MKNAAITVRLDADLSRTLARIAKRTGRPRSAVARDALTRYLVLAQIQDLRRRIIPLADARGYMTDDDVFSAVS